jgi:hypothetical protein
MAKPLFGNVKSSFAGAERRKSHPVIIRVIKRSPQHVKHQLQPQCLSKGQTLPSLPACLILMTIKVGTYDLRMESLLDDLGEGFHGEQMELKSLLSIPNIAA